MNVARNLAAPMRERRKVSLPEPTTPARIRCRTTLFGEDGTRHSVGPKTACAARATEDESVAWVETFVRQPTPLWRRALGHRRYALDMCGTMPWAALQVKERDTFTTENGLGLGLTGLRSLKQKHGRSCSLAASVATLVWQKPHAISELFVANADHSVTVRLHPQPVTVTYKLLPRSEGAPWWNILQKAFAVRGWPHDGSHTQACPGGYCDTFMQALTGEKAYAHELDLQSAAYLGELASKLSPAERERKGHYTPVENFLSTSIETKLKAGELVCMSTKPQLPYRAFGIQPEHSYAVLGVRRKIRNRRERVDVEIFEPRGGYTRFLELRKFLRAATVLCFGRVR